MEEALQVGSSVETSPKNNDENPSTSGRTETRIPPPMSRFVETLDPIKLMEQNKEKKQKRQKPRYESIDSHLKRLGPNALINPTAHDLRKLIGSLEIGSPDVIGKTETLSSSTETIGKTKESKYKNFTHQPKNGNLYDFLSVMVKEYNKPNIQIRCGDILFNCHMLVLQCYSEFFINCNIETCIDLPETHVKPSAFAMIYDWMLAEKPFLPRCGLLDVFTAAKYLGIHSLINHCWFLFDDDRRFKEDSACFLYLEAIQKKIDDLDNLRYIMVMRINKFFLTFVASKEFLALEVEELCYLLKSNAIGVNSEIEVLFAAIRWMRVNWHQGEAHLYEVALCIRYSLIPSWFLVSMINSDECDIFIKEIIKFPAVKELIDDGISYGTTLMYYGKNREQLKVFVNRFKFKLPAQRQWIFDGNCQYHRKMCAEESDKKYINITYRAFINYLKTLQKAGKDYFTNIASAKDEEHPLTYCLQPDIGADFDVLTAKQIKLKEELTQCPFDDKGSPVAVILRDVEIGINRSIDNNENSEKPKDVRKNAELLQKIMHDSKIFNTEPSTKTDDPKKTYKISDNSAVKPVRVKSTQGKSLSRENTSNATTFSENTIKMNEKTIREMNAKSIKQAILGNDKAVPQKQETIHQSKGNKSKNRAVSPQTSKMQDKSADVQKIKERQQLKKKSKNSKQDKSNLK